MPITRVPFLAVALFAGAAASCSAPPEGVVHVEINLPEQAVNVAGGPVAAGLLHGDDYVSASILRVSAPIALHRHFESEEIVYVLSGEGLLQLAHERRPLRAGDFAVVPRNTPHGFEPTGTEATVVLQIFTPHFVEGDRHFEEAQR